METAPLVVVARREEAEGVVGLDLADPSGRALPSWQPGAHLDLTLPSGLIRQYSLCGDPAELSRYRIAVLRETVGTGGSHEVHETVTVGTPLAMRGPRNHFALVDAPAYLFIAGGIGITPLLPMLRRVEAQGVPWQFVYGGRRAASMAFVDEVCGRRGGPVRLVPEDEVGRPDLARIIAGRPADAVIYCCGPEGLLRAVEEECAKAGLSGDLHLERFGANSAVPVPTGIAASDADSFEVHLAKSGLTVQVPPDRTLLDVVRDVVPDVPSSCEEGICGTCETEVLDGLPEHHDEVLDDAEHAAGKTMMICVGRSKSARLVLNL